MGKKTFTLFIIIIILFTSFNALSMSNIDGIPEAEKEIIANRENQIIVKYKNTPKLDRSKTSLGRLSHLDEDVKEVDDLTKLIQVEDSHMDQVMEILERDPEVEYVERNYTYKHTNMVNDPHYDKLWHLDPIRTKDAWKGLGGDESPVVIAVIDSGIDPHHPDLKNRIAPGGFNFFQDSTDIYDHNGHGTFISGIISAEADNNYGITGLAGRSNIKILPIRVSDHKGVASVYDIIRGIDYSIDQNVDIINLSLGGPDYSHSFQDAIDRALRANIVVVAAAGNEALRGNPVYYPAAYDGVISVGATDMANNRARFSSYNNFVDMVAPGQSIYSTLPYSSFDYESGTSYATPMVAATAGLLRSIDPSLGRDEIFHILTSTARDLGPVGRDPFYGYGLLDMERAIKLVGQSSPKTENYRDFQSMEVDNLKVFRIEFNHPLDLKSLDNNIFMSSDHEGKRVNHDYSLHLDPNNNKIVYLKPLGTWKRGYNYLFIKNGVMGLNGQEHREELRITVFVQ